MLVNKPAQKGNDESCSVGSVGQAENASASIKLEKSQSKYGKTMINTKHTSNYVEWKN